MLPIKIYYALPLSLSFSYGFYRQWSVQYQTPINLISDKLICSTINGNIYTLPPTLIFPYVRLLNRIEIKLSNKNPSEYSYSYREFFGTNNRLI